jgi:hypothetical protein
VKGTKGFAFGAVVGMSAGAGQVSRACSGRRSERLVVKDVPPDWPLHECLGSGAATTRAVKPRSTTVRKLTFIAGFGEERTAGDHPDEMRTPGDL